MTKPLKCRAHSGTFRVEVRRGRPPVNCTEENPCDRVTTKRKLAKATGLKESQIVVREPSRVERTASAIKNGRKTVTEPVDNKRIGAAMKERAAKAAERPRKAAAKAPEIDSEPRSTVSRSVQVAQASRAELEAVGWVAKGRGWTDGEDEMAELTATRGSETIVLTWCNGNLTGQDYSIWHSKPSRNAMPKRRLKFNPDEMTDAELIRAISGMKVTWWNSLAKSEESFTVGTRTLSIEHTFASNGDEDSSRRIVKFVDMNGGGFRHFHVDALLKVG